MEVLIDLSNTPPKKRSVKPKASGSRRNSRTSVSKAVSGDSIITDELSFKYPPSIYQMGVISFLRESSGSCIVDAKAGSGKTSTMEMIAANLNKTVRGKRQYVLMLAFNKSIASELSERMPSWIKCGTFHSVAFGTWMRHVKSKVELKDSKVRSILRQQLEEKEYKSLGSVAVKLIGLAKNAGIGTWLREDTDEAWSYLLSHHCIDIGEDEDKDLDDRKSRLIRYCRSALAENNRMRTVIDFDDMLYLPILENAFFFRNHIIFVDEAQDTNPIQLACLKRMLKKEGRLIAVGDPNQAIYGFRGADSQAIDKLKKWFDCSILPLSICYRCDKAIVREAQEIVPTIEFFDSKDEGKVESVLEYDSNTFRSGDAILCRNTSPLIRFAYSLISRRIPAKVMGRDIGNGLVKLIKDLKSETITQLSYDLQDWSDKQAARFADEDGGEAAIAMINDKVECIKVFMDNLSHTNFTISGLCSSIHDLFSDESDVGIQLGTVHRSKGHEWDRVFILEPDLMPSRWARLEWQRQQEINLKYVAITRAKHYLGYINSDCWKDD